MLFFLQAGELNSYYYTEWDSHLSNIFYDFEEQDHVQVSLY